MAVSIDDLNTIYGCIGNLRTATKVIDRRVRGTADPLYDLVKDFEDSIRRSEAAYKRIAEFE